MQRFPLVGNAVSIAIDSLPAAEAEDPGLLVKQKAIGSVEDLCDLNITGTGAGFGDTLKGEHGVQLIALTPGGGPGLAGDDFKADGALIGEFGIVEPEVVVDPLHIRTRQISVVEGADDAHVRIGGEEGLGVEGPGGGMGAILFEIVPAIPVGIFRSIG